jgi:hypothetical protein
VVIGVEGGGGVCCNYIPTFVQYSLLIRTRSIYAVQQLEYLAATFALVTHVIEGTLRHNGIKSGAR